MQETRPVARTEGFTTEESGGELLVYNESAELVLRLNTPAALVWRSCDGTRTIADLVAVLTEQLGGLADEDQVMVALDELAKHDMIQSGYDRREASAERLSRRQFVRRLGAVAAAAVALPVVQGMIVPTLAAASTHKPYHYHYINHHPHDPHDADND